MDIEIRMRKEHAERALFPLMLQTRNTIIFITQNLKTTVT